MNAEEPEELTALGFWMGGRGFHFDCRGPAVELTHLSAGRRLQSERIGTAALLKAARRLTGIGHAVPTTLGERRAGEQLFLL